MSHRPAALALVAFAAAGCHGCHEDHPYVPYTIDQARPAAGEGGAAAPAASSAAAADPAPKGSGEPSTPAPPGTSLWAIGDLSLQAPDGRVFVRAAVRDFDQDGALDAFAIVRPSEGNEPGELAYYEGRSSAGVLAGPTIVAPPAGLARDTSCAPFERLVVVGRRSVLVELGEACGGAGSIAPDRWFAVATGAPQPRVRFAATIADPPGAASLSVDADTADRDGDGREDLALGMTLEGGGAPLEPGPRVGATFAWLDRPAGLSRDLAATESSFASLAAGAAARALRPKDAPGVPALVAQVRALWRAACVEGGSPRVVGVAGTGSISCGAARALENAGLAEVRAYVTSGDALRAALALDRAERSPASRTASRASEAQGWIAQLAPAAAARSLRAVAAVPVQARGHEPAWGPLAFEPTGKLLVRTRAGVVRVDPDAGDEAAADGVADWKQAVTSADGASRWIEAYDPCDGLPLHATFATGGGEDLVDVALPVPAPLGGRCAGSRGAPARVLPLSWGPAGVEAIVEGEPVLISADLTRASPLAALLGQPFSPGSPRSPDGATLVVSTGAGLLVKRDTRARLLRAPELDGTYAEQRDCAVSNDGARVACVHVGKAWVGAWDGG